MEINVTLNLTDNQVADLLSWIMKDGIVKNVLIGECVKHACERIDEWETSVRLSNVCRANGIVTAADLISLTESQFLRLRGSGRKSLIEISQLMYNKGIKFKNEDAPQNTKEAVENIA